MYIIGISGAVGAGKTTLSNLLFHYKKTKIIHLDSLLNNIKKICKTDNFINLNGEDVVLIDKKSLIKKITKYSFIKNKALNLASLIASVMLIYKIKQAQNDNYEFLIIEGFTLQEYINLSCLDCSIYIEADENTRKKRVLKRGNGIDALNLRPTNKNFNITFDNSDNIKNLIKEINKLEIDTIKYIIKNKKESIINIRKNRIKVNREK